MISEECPDTGQIAGATQAPTANGGAPSIETAKEKAARERAEAASAKASAKLARDAERTAAKAASDKATAEAKAREKAERAAAKEQADLARAAAREARDAEKSRAKLAKEAQKRSAAAALLASKIERPSACTDSANAERFANMHRGRARFVPQWNLWLVYDGKRWAKDACGVRVGKLAKDTGRTIYAEARATEDSAERRALAEWASYSEAKKQREAMIALARSEDGMSVDFTELDAHPALFNCANGTLDLVRGELRPHNPADLLTKISPVKYDPAAKCERFDRFLSEIMMADAGSVEFLRRWLGYCLTGSIREHTMCFWHGETGGNGKSTLAGVMFHVMGDYAIKAAPDILFRSAKTDRHPTELADLHGARLAVCNETQAKRTWDEATVKDITGGDPIKARRMREDFWSFTPSHKLTVFGNAKPTIANPDDGGMRRRLRLVPFEVSFADAPDKKLDVTLRKEATGILADLVRACLAWQKDGLTEPTVIADATAEYFAEQDTIGRFVAERCDLNPLAKMSRKDLRLALDAWADEVGEEKVNPKDIAKWLAQHNVTGTSVRDAGNRPVDGWAGIRLKLVAASNVDTRIGERDAS